MNHDVGPVSDPRLLSVVTGSLLGGAVGDALGAPIEFLSLAQIRARFGSQGLRDFHPAYGRIGAITDDTQMTLFTVEGLLRARNRLREKGICHLPSVVHFAYLRWLATQGMTARNSLAGAADGWLSKLPALQSRRAPGNTCLSALASGKMGTIEKPINTSKGCGGIMRIAPVGLIRSDDPFKHGCEIAAITHGHPSGWLAAGFFARALTDIVKGNPLAVAIARARDELEEWPSHQECLDAVDSAVRLAEEGDPTAEKVERLGAGWVAEEALAIALYCALVASDFADGVLLAVNHSGDGDSTGALTGNLLGALLGKDAIPATWHDRLELRAEIEELATDLYRFYLDDNPPDPEDTRDKYPGW